MSTERVEEASRTRALVVVHAAESAAAVRVTLAVPCSMQQFVVSLVAVAMEKELMPEYQLFCTLVITTPSELPITEVLVMVIDRTWADVLKQETDTPEVELVHWKPLTRVMVVGSVRKMRSPEQCWRAKVSERVQLVRELAVVLTGVSAEQVIGVEVVIAIVTLEFTYSMGRLLQQVLSYREAVGLVEKGLSMLLITILRVVLTGRELGTQLVSEKFMLEVGDMVQEAMRVEPEVKEERTALFALGKSEGNVRVRELPAGRGLRICAVRVQVELAATTREELVTAALRRVTGLAVRVSPVVRQSMGVDVFLQQVLMAKEEVAVVVTGLLAQLIVIGILVPPPIATALMLRRREEELARVQVELMVQEQVLEAEKVISEGRVRIILEPETSEFMVVKVTVMLETTPIESLDMVAVATVMREGVAASEMVLESTEQQVPETRFWVRKVIVLLSVAQGALVRVKVARKRVVKSVVALVRFPMSSVLVCPEEQVSCVVCWLEVTQEKASCRSGEQVTERQEADETGLERLSSSETLPVAEMAVEGGAKVSPVKVLGRVGAKEVVQVMQEGCEVLEMQQSRLAVRVMFCVEAGLRAFWRVRVLLLDVAAEQREEQVSISEQKLCAVLGERMVHCPLQTEEARKLGKFVSEYELQAGNCI